MITDMNSRVAMAQKLSIPQLQQAIKNGTVPAYVGVPMLQDKMRQQKQMQMAVAQQQQGQQQQRPIAEEVMAEASRGGVDQLPSNLPIQNEEDEEGYAGGGIIAFSETGQVRDPDSDPKTDGIFSGLMNRRVGNTVRSLVDRFKNRNAGEPDLSDTAEARETEGQTLADRQAIQDRVDISKANYHDLVNIGGRTIGTVGDYAARGINALGGNVPRVPAEYTFNRSNAPLKPNIQALLAGKGGFEANYPVSSQPAASPNIDSQYIAQDMQEGNRGITAAPGASSPAQRGAPTSGAVSPATARQISATNPGAPATLKDAERQAASGSPQASATVSMLDRYVAMLEKSGDDVGRQKKEALYMALIQGGLGMMGGTSPNAFANISAGLLPATQAYQQAIAGIRKDDRARIEKLINAGMSKEKLGMELRKLGIEEKKVDAMVNYYNARAGAAGAGDGNDNKKNTAYNLATNAYQREVGRTDALIAKIKQDNNMYLDYTGKDPIALGKKNRILSDITNLNNKKDNLYTQYRGYVTDRLGIEVPDFSNPTGGGGKDGIDLDKFFK